MRTDSVFGWSMLLAVEVALAASLAVMNPIVPIAVLVVVAGLPALIVMPRWAAVVALVLVLPPYDYSFFTSAEGSDFTFLEVGVLIALGKWALDGIRERRLYFDVTAFDIPVILLLGYAALSLFWAPSAGRGIHQAIRVAEGFAIYFALVNLIRERRDFEWALTTWVLLSAVIAVAAFVFVVQSSIPATAGLQLPEGEVDQRLGKTVRVTLFFDQPNGLAFFLSISTLLTVIRYYWTRSILQKLFYAGSIVVMMLVLAATFSRKSWLGIALALGIVGLRSKGSGRGLFGDPGRRPPHHHERHGALRGRALAALHEPFIDPGISIPERWMAWQIGLQLFHKSPLLGNGVGAFYTLAWRLGSPLVMPHNFYMYLMAELGLVGLSLFVILAVHFAWGLWTAIARLTEPYMNFVATLLFGCWLSILFQCAFRTIGLTDALFWGFLGQVASFVRLAAAEGRAALAERPEKDQPTEAPEAQAVRVA